MQNTVPVLIFRHWKTRQFSIGISCHDSRNFTTNINFFLQYAINLACFVISIIKFSSVIYNKLPFTVITQSIAFQDSRKTNFNSSLLQIALLHDSEVWYWLQPGLQRKLFFQVSVLRSFERFCARVNGGFIRDKTDALGWNIFKFEGNSITLFRHIHKRCLICVVGLNMNVSDKPGTARWVRIQNYYPITHGTGGHTKHTAQLPTT